MIVVLGYPGVMLCLDLCTPVYLEIPRMVIPLFDESKKTHGQTLIIVYG